MVEQIFEDWQQDILFIDADQYEYEEKIRYDNIREIHTDTKCWVLPGHTVPAKIDKGRN